MSRTNSKLQNKKLIMKNLVTAVSMLLASALLALLIVRAEWRKEVRTLAAQLQQAQTQISEMNGEAVAASIKLRETEEMTDEVGKALNSTSESVQRQIAALQLIVDNWKSNYYRVEQNAARRASAEDRVREMNAIAAGVLARTLETTRKAAENKAIVNELEGIKRAIQFQDTPNPFLRMSVPSMDWNVPLPQYDWMAPIRDYQRQQLIDGVNRTAAAVENQTWQRQIENLGR